MTIKHLGGIFGRNPTFNDVVAEDVTINENLVVDSSTSDLVQFKKNGALQGKVKAFSSDIFIGTGDTNLRFADASDAISPCVAGGTVNDGNTDLGLFNSRFKDIYATNGTIQTSDRNEKRDIEIINEAEKRVAIASKSLLKKFRWNSAVEQKGEDEARIHFGIIAQDLEAAFSAEGLDASRYGMFIRSTWEDENGVTQERLGVRYSELLAFIIAGI